MNHDYPLIRKVLEHVYSHPEEHDQDTWGYRTPCRTTHCIAGHAVILSGAKPQWEKLDRPTHYNMVAAEHDGRLWGTATLAEHLLGLTTAEADYLFFEVDEVGALDVLERMLEGEAA